MTTANWEANEIALVHESSILSVLSILVRRFQIDHGSLPEVVYLNANCRMALTVELITVCKLAPGQAVLEPVWLLAPGKEVPMLYTSQLGEQFVQLINSKIGAISTL